MFNMMRMDLYRMFHTRSLYVVWIILAAGILFSTYMCKIDYETAQELSAEETEADDMGLQVDADGTVNVDVGMLISLPTQAQDDVTLFDLVYAQLQGKFVSLFLIIFAVLFTAVDKSSGYIKNIGGQVKSRIGLVLSKASVLVIYTILSMLLYLLLQIAAQALVLGQVTIGDAAAFWKYFGIQTLLNAALMLIGMAVTIVAGNTVASMIIAMCLVMNMAMVLYSLLDILLSKIGIDNISVSSYTVTGKMAMLSMYADNAALRSAAVIAIGFGAAAAVIASLVFQRRDI